MRSNSIPGILHRRGYGGQALLRTATVRQARLGSTATRACFAVAWMAAAALVWGGDTAPVAAVGPAAKVIGAYALTSANDFPPRDPFDWRLLGSNDGGRTWKTLDKRTGELFTQRHQRRVFTLNNRVPYTVYRLQIDRVRDPAAVEAVQLAELELMGITESDTSPTPVPPDLVTAQGANPPVESPLRVFDGRVETKWLDRVRQNPTSRASWIQWQYVNRATLLITNAAQLDALRQQAAEGYPVRIAGVSAGVAGTNLYLLDTTDYVAVNGYPEPGVLPGQPLVVEGRSGWSGDQVVVTRAAVSTPGPPAPTHPRRIEVGQAITAAEDFQWVELEGAVQFVSWMGHCRRFELGADEQSVSVVVLDGKQEDELPASGTRIRVRGVGSGLINVDGVRVIGTVWVASAKGIERLEASPVGGTRGPTMAAGANWTNTAGLADIEQLRRLGAEVQKLRPNVRVRGVVTELFGSYIQQGDEGIEVQTAGADGLTLPAQQLGYFVEAEGEASWSPQRGTVIALIRSTFLGPGKLPEPRRPSWRQLASGQMDSTWIEVDAVVRATDGSHLLLDHEGRQMMATIRSAPVSRVRELIDASVRLRGVCITAADDRGIAQGVQLAVPALEFVEVRRPAPEAATLPVRKIDSLYQVGSRIDFSHRIKVQGVLTLRQGRQCFLEDSTGGLVAVAQEDVVLTEPSRGSRWVFWQNSESDDSPPDLENLEPGDEVEVIGFPESRGYAPLLTEARVRKLRRTTPPSPVFTTARELAMGKMDSTLVQLEGLLLAKETLGTHCLMQIESGERVFQASLRVKQGEIPAVEPGSRVQLTGVCHLNPAVQVELGKSPAVFSLLLRSPADLTVLEAAPWWTPQRALGAAGALAVVLVAAMVWIRMLRQTVEARTGMLQREIGDHEKTEARLAEETKLLQQEIEEHRRTEADLAEKTRLLELEIEERKRVEAEVELVHKELLSASRLAGMADVATSVLHNVGNVLNSVNVLAAFLTNALQKSKVAGVARLSALLNERREDLGRFITEDEHGRHVPAHLERLGSQLLDEHDRLLDKAKSLNEGIQHVKEIVAMQQNYAKVAGVTETVRIAEVVEDALRMCSGGLARHGIQVVREYDDLPAVTIDRHKVLQLLFNLLDNAKYACEAGMNPPARVIVRVRRTAADRIQIQIADNGVGIPAENLSRIFTQGFSTRKGGHGFGLHGSILSAQDMGGSLTVQSDGAGRGATFTLEIPARCGAAEPGLMKEAVRGR